MEHTNNLVKTKHVKSVQRWLIVFACFLINFSIFCVFRSSGIFYLKIVKTFNCSYSEAAWPFTLTGGVASITGLPAGFLNHFFTARLIVCGGILITAISISSCFFATYIGTVIVLLGVTQGNMTVNCD